MEVLVTSVLGGARETKREKTFFDKTKVSLVGTDDDWQCQVAAVKLWSSEGKMEVLVTNGGAGAREKKRVRER